jgi:hypothetical protein
LPIWVPSYGSINCDDANSGTQIDPFVTLEDAQVKVLAQIEAGLTDMQLL